MNILSISKKDKTTGEAAVDGLLGGLIAGVLMILIFILAGLIAGETPAGVLERFATQESSTPLMGGLVHLAVSGIYGVIFSLLVFWLPVSILRCVPGWLCGLFYSFLLLVLAVNVILPGLRSPLQEMPLPTLAVGHLVYGLVLGRRVYPEIHPSGGEY
jgi:hypothetical protein